MYLKQSLHTQCIFLSFSRSLALLFICLSRLFFFGAWWLHLCVCFFGPWRGWSYGVHVVGHRVGYASRRAMLQQLHGVSMYSHDEYHTSAPYCWSERGKGASATIPSTAVLQIIIRSSISQYVNPSCGPVSSCLAAVGPIPKCRTCLLTYFVKYCVKYTIPPQSR